MADKKNEKWDGYFKTPIKDPIFGDDLPGLQAKQLIADTTKKMVKFPGYKTYNDLMTMNLKIAFLDAIGQLEYADKFYYNESMKNEDFQLTSRISELEKFLRDSKFKILNTETIELTSGDIKLLDFEANGKTYRLELKELK